MDIEKLLEIIVESNECIEGIYENKWPCPKCGSRDIVAHSPKNNKWTITCWRCDTNYTADELDVKYEFNKEFLSRLGKVENGK